MLAHTTSRHIIIGVQLAIGMALLSASYFSDNGISANSPLKAKIQQEQSIEAIQSKPKNC